MKRSTLIHAAAFAGAGVILAVPFLAFADDTFVPLTNLPGISSISASAISLPSFINNLYRIAIGVAAFFAVVEIAWAGYLLMTSADSISKNTEARKKITNAIIGLVLVLSPYIVFSIINPKILNIGLNFSGLQSKVSGGDVNPDFTDNSTATTQQKICTPYQKSGAQLAYVSLVGSQTCSAAKGKGWAQVDGCCASPTPSGQTCCGYDPLNDQTVTDTSNLNGPASFSIAYQDSAYLKDTDTTQSACVAYDDRSFPDKQSCVAAFNGATAVAKGTIAVSKSCDDTGAHSLTPAAAAAQLKKLPSCPTH